MVGKVTPRRSGPEVSPSFADPELSDLRQELLDASVQTSALERELADAKSEAEQLRSELQKTGSDGDARRKLQDELNRLTAEHQALCAKYTAAASDRDTAVACTEQMASEIEQLRSRAEAAEELMDEAAQQVEDLRREGVELTQAVAAAQEEVSAYANKLQDYERELTDERARHIETQSDRTAAMRRIESLEQEQKSLETEVASLRASLAEEQQVAAKLAPAELALAETSTKLKETEQRLTTLEKDFAESSAECQSLRRSLSENTAGKELMIARDQLSEVTQERERLNGEVRQLADDLKAITTAKADRDEQIKNLSRELDEARRRAEAASEARLRQDNEVLRGIIARQNSELEQKHAQLVRLKRARLGVRLAYASFALGLVLVAAWAIKTVPGMQLSGLLKF
jgi:chromosome segregation ATPase